MSDAYYLDTNAFFKYYCEEKGSEKIRELVSNNQNICYISELTFLEITNILLTIYRTPTRDQRKNSRRLQAYSKKRVKQIIIQMLEDIEISLFKLEKVPMDDLLDKARTILLDHAENLNFGSLDALHIAIVERRWQAGKICFVTSDGNAGKNGNIGSKLTGLCEKLNIPTYNPEK